MRIRFEKSGRYCVLPGKPFAGGGEGDLYRLPDPAGGGTDIAVKIYRKPTREHASKLRAMLANPPVVAYTGGHVFIAWPTEQIVPPSGNAECVGYAMPFVPNARPIADLYNPRYRKLHFPSFTDVDLLRTAKDLAAAFRSVHRQGHIIGDVNELNILVNQQGRVILIDTDSFQIVHEGKVYRCVVGKMEYTPPELLGKRSADVDRVPMHDNFALGVILFQLLMGGFHPFGGVYTGPGEPPPTETVIKGGHWPFSNTCSGPYRPPPAAPSFGRLPPGIRELFRRCFEDGVGHPGRRPDAGHWEEALKPQLPPPPPQASTPPAAPQAPAQPPAPLPGPQPPPHIPHPPPPPPPLLGKLVWVVAFIFSGVAALVIIVSWMSGRRTSTTETENGIVHLAETGKESSRVLPGKRVENNEGGPTTTSKPETANSTQPTKVLSTSQDKIELPGEEATRVPPEKARDWVGRRVITEMTVMSSKDLGWALALNSKPDFRLADNLEIALVKEREGRKIEQSEIKAWEQRFRVGTAIRVTGKVEEYPDPKTKNIRYQIKVYDLEQIKVR